MVNASANRGPLSRIAGSVISWFLFALCITLLFNSTLVVMALGGACASGGAYEIRVECPPGVALFAPASIFGGFIAAAISLWFSFGFGVSLLDLAWPILFTSLGGGFIYAFVISGDLTGLVVGILFILMGLTPLWFLLRAGAREIVLGTINLHGEKFVADDNGRSRILPRPHPSMEATVHPQPADWLLSIGLFAVAAFTGYQLGQWLYAASVLWGAEAS